MSCRGQLQGLGPCQKQRRLHHQQQHRQALTTSSRQQTIRPGFSQQRWAAVRHVHCRAAASDQKNASEPMYLSDLITFEVRTHRERQPPQSQGSVCCGISHNMATPPPSSSSRAAAIYRLTCVYVPCLHALRGPHPPPLTLPLVFMCPPQTSPNIQNTLCPHHHYQTV